MLLFKQSASAASAPRRSSSASMPLAAAPLSAGVASPSHSSASCPPPAQQLGPVISSSRPRAVATAALGSTNGPKWWEKETPNMHNVGTVQELVDQLADAGDNLVIVDFYAPWCGACRALYPKLIKLLEAFPDVVFLKVNFDENKAMCKTLGVKVLPYFHIYHGAEGRVAAFSCTTSKFQRMRDALEEFYTPICSLEGNPGLPEFPEIMAHPNEVTRVAGMALASADERHSGNGAAAAAAGAGAEQQQQQREPAGVA